MDDHEYDYHYAYVCDTPLLFSRPFVGHIKRVIRKMPSNVLREIASGNKMESVEEELPKEKWPALSSRSIIALAPPLRVYGLTMHFDGCVSNHLFMYLSPLLLEKSDREIEGVIAIQFARIFQNQEGFFWDELKQAAKQGTDVELAAKWGFDVSQELASTGASVNTDLNEEPADQPPIINRLFARTTSWLGTAYRKHIPKVFLQLPQDVQEDLVNRKPAFVARDANALGDALPMRDADDDEDFWEDPWIIYLSPECLRLPLEEIEYTIAHEFAHLHLGHESRPSPKAREDATQGEQEANDLAETWEFPDPY